jgi:hypothetical protein
MSHGTVALNILPRHLCRWRNSTRFAKKPANSPMREAKVEAGTSRRRQAPGRLSHAGSGETNPELNDAIPF